MLFRKKKELEVKEKIIPTIRAGGSLTSYLTLLSIISPCLNISMDVGGTFVEKYKINPYGYAVLGYGPSSSILKYFDEFTFSVGPGMQINQFKKEIMNARKILTSFSRTIFFLGYIRKGYISMLPLRPAAPCDYSTPRVPLMDQIDSCIPIENEIRTKNNKFSVFVAAADIENIYVVFSSSLIKASIEPTIIKPQEGEGDVA
ncbi:MAG: hypothetical protein QW341_06100 [Candidatus Bathyarchaeia archaeon]